LFPAAGNGVKGNALDDGVNCTLASLAGILVKQRMSPSHATDDASERQNRSSIL
jgi:hypothetical protein